MKKILAVTAGVLAAAAISGCGESVTSTTTVVTIVQTQAVPPPADPTPPARRATRAKQRSVVLPDLAGERLDVAEATLDDLKLRYRVIGGGTFGVVVASNWVVCETRPHAGAADPRRVDLIVDRAC